LRMLPHWAIRPRQCPLSFVRNLLEPIMQKKRLKMTSFLSVMPVKPRWALLSILCVSAIVLLPGCSGRLARQGGAAYVDAETGCEEAERAVQRKDFQTAIVLYEQFLKKHPGNGLALYHLGFAYGQVGDRPQEVVSYQKALAAGLRNDVLLFNLGMAYGEMGEMEKAVTALRDAVALAPESADNHFGLGMAYQGIAEDDLAEHEFLKAIEIDPAHLDARLFLGMLYADAGDLQKARGQLEKILEIDPDYDLARDFLETILKQ
jgi:tetratricopeptide (TPR) repeat protein